MVMGGLCWADLRGIFSASTVPPLKSYHSMFAIKTDQQMIDDDTTPVVTFRNRERAPLLAPSPGMSTPRKPGLGTTDLRIPKMRYNVRYKHSTNKYKRLDVIYRR